jgi:hypothetical protein
LRVLLTAVLWYATCASRSHIVVPRIPHGRRVRCEASRPDWMDKVKVLGFVLVVLGVLALVYGGITYNRERTVLDVGPFKATATEQKNIPLSPIVGGIALLGGILLLVVPRKRVV